MIKLNDSEKQLIRLYKNLRIKEIKNKEKLEQEITLTEHSILLKETQEIEKQIKKIRDHFSDIVYQKWIKSLDEKINS